MPCSTRLANRALMMRTLTVALRPDHYDYAARWIPLAFTAPRRCVVKLAGLGRGLGKGAGAWTGG
jgi:hypothetical protein